MPDVAGVTAAVEAGADLERATDAAIEQRVGPLLLRALDAAGVERGPVWGDELHREAMFRRAHALVLQPRALRQSIEPLLDAGFEPLVFKGAALADRYPGVGLRPMDDIDVVLPARQGDPALAVLERAGWRPVPHPRAPWSGRAHETKLIHPDFPAFPLELHRAFESWGERASDLSSRWLWTRRRPCLIGGLSAFGLDPEDEIVLLAAHGGKPFHQFNRLLWSVDVAVVLAAVETAGGVVDWDRVARQADDLGCRTVLAVALAQARRLGATVPGVLLTPAARGARRRALAPLFDPEWPVREQDNGVRRRLRYALADRRRRRVTLLAAELSAGGVRAIPARARDLLPRAVRRWHQLRSGVESGNGAVSPHPVDR